MREFPTKEQVERIRQQYPVGCRLILDEMPEDPFPVPPGTMGEVVGVDDAGQLLMKWQNGRSLSLIPGVDRFHAAPKEQTAREQLKEKITASLARYQKDWLDKSPQELMAMADQIFAVQIASETLARSISEEQAAFLLRFQDPLEVISEEWRTRAMDDYALGSNFSELTETLMEEDDLAVCYPMEQDMGM